MLYDFHRGDREGVRFMVGFLRRDFFLRMPFLPPPYSSPFFIPALIGKSRKENTRKDKNIF
jgi:hypothetical protein